ncbi:MAG TPA: glycosyltransferase family 2 protein [Candidatus Dormibacteraeota bacterium]|nr:glycosyltransferase family 2 protein [Candidatus Dormibacteraeota bacterium]
MDISVIILTRNTCDQTRDAIQSVLSSSDKFQKEIFVIDNASTDETPALIPLFFPQIHFHRMDRNLGFARGVNFAAHRCSGDFLLLLNSDARLAPYALTRAVDWMHENPRCGIAGAQLLHPDGRQQTSIGRFPTIATELINQNFLHLVWPGRYPGRQPHVSAPVEVDWVIGAFFLIRREVWNQLNGLDEDFFFYFEEADFCLRARQVGCSAMYLPQVIVFHGQGRTSQKYYAGARIEFWRSRYHFLDKHYGYATRLALRIGLPVRLLVDSFFSALLTVVTLGQSPHWRRKCASHGALLLWHLRGCPASGGLPR